jgi:hypothetical protein
MGPLVERVLCLIHRGLLPYIGGLRCFQQEIVFEYQAVNIGGHKARMARWLISDHIRKSPFHPFEIDYPTEQECQDHGGAHCYNPKL